MTPNAPNSESIAIGVDVGGRKVAVGFCNHLGEILQYTRAPMNPNGTAAEGFAAVTSAIDPWEAEAAWPAE